MRVEYSARRLNRDIFLHSFNMQVCCVFSLESPHQDDSNGYIQYTVSQYKKKITLNCPNSAAIGFYPKGLKNEFETAVVNEPSEFEPLKFYCTINIFISCTEIIENFTNVLHS